MAYQDDFENLIPDETIVQYSQWTAIRDAIIAWAAAYHIDTSNATFNTLKNLSITSDPNIQNDHINALIGGLQEIQNVRSVYTSLPEEDPGTAWTAQSNVAKGELIRALGFDTIEGNIQEAQNRWCSACDTSSTGYNYNCDCEGGFGAVSDQCPTDLWYCGCDTHCDGNADCGAGAECGCAADPSCNQSCYSCDIGSFDQEEPCTNCDGSCHLYSAGTTDYSCTNCYTAAHRYPYTDLPP